MFLRNPIYSFDLPNISEDYYVIKSYHILNITLPYYIISVHIAFKEHEDRKRQN